MAKSKEKDLFFKEDSAFCLSQASFSGVAAIAETLSLYAKNVPAATSVAAFCAAAFGYLVVNVVAWSNALEDHLSSVELYNSVAAAFSLGRKEQDAAGTAALGAAAFLGKPFDIVSVAAALLICCKQKRAAAAKGAALWAAAFLVSLVSVAGQVVVSAGILVVGARPNWLCAIGDVLGLRFLDCCGISLVSQRGVQDPAATLVEHAETHDYNCFGFCSCWEGLHCWHRGVFGHCDNSRVTFCVLDTGYSTGGRRRDSRARWS